MASTATASGLKFGVGLSPMNVWNDWSGETRNHLTAKLADLHACGCEVLSLQFDDMHGDVPHLARLQAEIVGFVRSEEHTSELQSLMRISYAVFCLKKKNSSVYDSITTK